MTEEDIYIPEINARKELILFIGRPNAGKSSWLQALFGIRRVKGKMPGSTKRIAVLASPNHSNLSIIDVPGWGRVSGRSRAFASKVKDQIISFVDSYTSQIKLAILVIDIVSYQDVSERLMKKSFLPIDIEFAELFNSKNLDFVILANKKDKLTSHQLPASITYLEESISYTSPIFIHPCSSHDTVSIRQTREKINRLLFE